MDVIIVISPSDSAFEMNRPVVQLPVDDVAVLLGLLDLLMPQQPVEGDAVHALASRIRGRLSIAIAAAVESTPSSRTA